MIRVIFLLLLPVFCVAQNLPTNKQAAIEQIEALKNGALVVRLKTSDKSVAAYRKSGRNDVADRIVADRERQNMKIIKAFKDYFDFCPVYFVYATATNDLLAGKSVKFLNDTLGVNDTVTVKGKYFLFAEYGVLNTNMQQDDSHASGTKRTDESSNPSSNSAIFISDTSLNQLQEPFPFAQVVMMDNYHKAVERLNGALYRFYFNRVTKPSYKQPYKKS